MVIWVEAIAMGLLGGGLVAAAQALLRCLT